MKSEDRRKIGLFSKRKDLKEFFFVNLGLLGVFEFIKGKEGGNEKDQLKTQRTQINSYPIHKIN